MNLKECVALYMQLLELSLKVSLAYILIRERFGMVSSLPMTGWLGTYRQKYLDSK